MHRAATARGEVGGAARPIRIVARRSIGGEVKRLYVQPAHRGGGWGRRLAEALIAEARAIGYPELKLDTLDWMNDARRLYAELGFRECAPYYDNPLPGVVYMALALSRTKRERAGRPGTRSERLRF